MDKTSNDKNSKKNQQKKKATTTTTTITREKPHNETKTKRRQHRQAALPLSLSTSMSAWPLPFHSNKCWGQLVSALSHALDWLMGRHSRAHTHTLTNTHTHTYSCGPLRARAHWRRSLVGEQMTLCMTHTHRHTHTYSHTYTCTSLLTHLLLCSLSRAHLHALSLSHSLTYSLSLALSFCVRVCVCARSANTQIRRMSTTLGPLRRQRASEPAIARNCRLALLARTAQSTGQQRRPASWSTLSLASLSPLSLSHELFFPYKH